MTTTIHVAQPNFWWRAPAQRLRDVLELTDPDLQDGRRRWPDRDQQRWPLVAQAISAVSAALAAGSWRQPEPNSRHVVVEIPENDLTDTELKIVRSWFNHAEAVRADPWLYIANGRHRLWSTMPFMSQPVPVAGCDLKGANPVDAEDIGPSWTKYFVEDLRALHRLTWFDVGDPVNARFCRALAQAADGAFPSPV